MQSSGIERLLEGNQRFITGKLAHPNRCVERREKVAEAQTPFAVILCCSDSRLPPEIIFDQGLGDLFVVRVAGNVIGSLTLETIKFAVIYLKATTILVMGHSDCGAVRAVSEGIVHDIPDIANLIQPSIVAKLESSIVNNAVRMANYLKEQSFTQDHKTEVYSGYYDLKSGELTLID